MSAINHGALTFFSEMEAVTVDAMAARIIPSDDSGPGAREAEVVVYIDRALAGFYADLQTLYRRGVRELNRFCQDRHGAPFSELREADQDAVLASMDPFAESAAAQERTDPGSRLHNDSRSEVGKVAEGSSSEHGAQFAAPDALLPRFFAVVRRHTLEGLFCDPVYGGNQGQIGWELVGFPGAQWSYSAEQMRPGFDARQIPARSLEDLRREYGRIKTDPKEHPGR